MQIVASSLSGLVMRPGLAHAIRRKEQPVNTLLPACRRCGTVLALGPRTKECHLLVRKACVGDLRLAMLERTSNKHGMPLQRMRLCCRR